MDAELLAIETNNQCLEQEVRAKEIAAAQQAQDEALLESNRAGEEQAVRALNMAKLKTETRKQAIRAEEEALRADAREVVAARRCIEAAEAAAQSALRKEQEAQALTELQQRNADAAAAELELLARERAVQARHEAELAQKNALIAARIAEMEQAHEEAEQAAEAEAQKRLEAARRLFVMNAQRAASERAARGAAEENAAMQAEIIALEESVLQREAHKNEKLRGVLETANARLDSELLLGKLRRSLRFNRALQGALAVSLLLLGGGAWLLPTAPSPARPVLDTALVLPPPTARARVESFKLSTELSQPPLRIATVE